MNDVVSYAMPQDGSLVEPGLGRLPSAHLHRNALRVGLITNPRSRRNRHGEFAREVSGIRDLPQAQPRTPEELVEVLTEFRQREVGVIAVSGGDGTLREVLTALPRVYGEDHPCIALLPAGKTNLAARVVSRVDGGAAGLLRLIEAARAGTLSRIDWPLLEVSWRDEPDRRIRGFLFGAAGFAAGTQIANAHIHKAGFNNAAAVVLSIAATAASTLFGAHRRDLLAGEDIGLGINGAAPSHGRRFLTLATTLDRLVLGLTPFWGEGDGAVRWLDVPAPPKHLLRALFPTLRGKPRAWMTEAGYASGRAHDLSLSLSRPFVVDGEVFEAGPSGVILSGTPKIGFVSA